MPSKIEWPFPVSHETCWKWRFKSHISVFLVSTFSRIWAGWLNKVHIYNKVELLQAVLKRPPNVPLITVSNHRSCIDDPFIWGIFKKFSQRNNISLVRWTPTAEEIVFTNPVLTSFFSWGQCVPIVRGDGVYQKAMDFCIEKLNKGLWVHTFPEGKVIEHDEWVRLKWGVGRLIAECHVCPIVLPLWHVGMTDVLPNTQPYVPRIGKKVTLLVGKPIKFDVILQRLKDSGAAAEEIRKDLTDRIQEEFASLKQEAERLHALTS